MRMNDQHDTSIVVRKPSRWTSTTRPCSASFGENAIEWTTKSSFPHSFPMRSNTASISPGVRTSSGIRIGRFELARQRLDVFLRLLVEIGHGKLGAECPECLGAAPRDRILVGDADDKAFLALEQLGFHDGNHEASTANTSNLTLEEPALTTRMVSMPFTLPEARQCCGEYGRRAPRLRRMPCASAPNPRAT